MTAVAFDNNSKWYWLTSAPSDNAAVTQAEVGAGTLIPDITAFDTPNSQSEVDTSDLDSLYDTSVVGTTKAGPITLTIKRDDTDETDTWDLFATPRANGYLIKTLNGVAAENMVYELYPVQVGVRQPASYSRNAVQTFVVTFAVTSEPELDGSMAA